MRVGDLSLLPLIQGYTEVLPSKLFPIGLMHNSWLWHYHHSQINSFAFTLSSLFITTAWYSVHITPDVAPVSLFLFLSWTEPTNTIHPWPTVGTPPLSRWESSQLVHSVNRAPLCPLGSPNDLHNESHCGKDPPLDFMDYRLFLFFVFATVV